MTTPLPPRRSTRRPLLAGIVALVGLTAVALSQRNPSMNTANPVTKDQAYSDMVAFAEEHLKLKRIQCGDIASVRPDTPCFVTDLTPEELPGALERLPEIDPVTHWRDDYGVMSAGFAWKDTPYELGVVYARATLEDFNDRADVKGHKGVVTIAIDDRS